LGAEPWPPGAKFLILTACFFPPSNQHLTDSSGTMVHVSRKTSCLSPSWLLHCTIKYNSLWFFSAGLGQPRASRMLGKLSTSKLNPHSLRYSLLGVRGSPYFSFALKFLFFLCTGNGTQGLTHVGQALRPLSHTPTLFACVLFLK
jgi:hypothetical protein